MPVLKLEHIRKNFGQIKATDNVDLSVEEGEIHALIGPNGAGKTTLINQIAGNFFQDSGRIIFCGQDISRMPAHKRALAGLARTFQISSVFDDMTVFENVALSVQATKGHSFRFLKNAGAYSEIRKKVWEYLEITGLADIASEMSSRVSYGEKNKIELAMALASNPKLILLDEPASGMSIGDSVELIKLLKKIKGSQSILLVEHDMDVIFSLADRISVLVYGKILATGTPEEVKNNSEVLEAYLGGNDRSQKPI
jgi:branched-chain amino acid transport system ATP-binding protein